MTDLIQNNYLSNSLLIVNRSGGLIYSSTDQINLNNSNRNLVVGSTIHSLIEIANELFKSSPHRCVVEYEKHSIFIYKTLSKTLIIFLWEKKEPPFKEIYAHYAEKVMRNYFYKIDMPINYSEFNPNEFFK